MPFRCWAIDYLPMLPLTSSGFSHLLLCIDPFSKWVELYPMRSKRPAEVVETLELNLIARFGVPLELRMDRGLEFAGELNDFCKRLGIS